MARLGKRPVKIPEGVKVDVKGGKVLVEGPKGKLEHKLFPNLDVVVEDGGIFVKNTAPQEDKKLFKKAEAFQGLLRSLSTNMVIGVKDGFEKILEVHGVGYKSQVQGKKLILSLGFSHPYEIDVPDGVDVEVVSNTVIFVRGINKQQVGNFAAIIKRVSPPEPYKGKGIRFRGEYVRHKAGKTGVGA